MSHAATEADGVLSLAPQCPYGGGDALWARSRHLSSPTISARCCLPRRRRGTGKDAGAPGGMAALSLVWACVAARLRSSSVLWRGNVSWQWRAR
jgi:hypothetical protein